MRSSRVRQRKDRSTDRRPGPHDNAGFAEDDRLNDVQVYRKRRATFAGNGMGNPTGLLAAAPLITPLKAQ
jgi:hypothetical protein